ncbi:MAG TPA: nucleotidyl transferase AbiEii/AbiGii toxin family protein [Bryobacteraceae bacterium]|nr:nucleotidyl transferase AbiEii/AbiGii toxin family protein [Bryobacteraceae bacterium]
MIPQRNFSLLANRLAKDGGRRLPESVLERDYCLAWFLAALAESDLRAVLGFKGGTALKRCYFGDYRFSEDLDFTFTTPVTPDELKTRLAPVYAAVREASGIVFGFDREDRQKHDNCYTFYLRYEGPLPRGNDVKVDITLREMLVYPLQERAVLRGYDEYTDLPEDRRLLAYSLAEITTEKTLALADRARNEPRDLYYLWHLTSNEGIELGALAGAMRQKLEFRGKPCGSLANTVLAKEARLRALWAARLGYQMAALPEFDEVFRAVHRTLRQADLP